jgi:hypothetical protein
MEINRSNWDRMLPIKLICEEVDKSDIESDLVNTNATKSTKMGMDVNKFVKI